MLHKFFFESFGSVIFLPFLFRIFISFFEVLFMLTIDLMPFHIVDILFLLESKKPFVIVRLTIPFHFSNIISNY